MDHESCRKLKSPYSKEKIWMRPLLRWLKADLPVNQSKQRTRYLSCIHRYSVNFLRFRECNTAYLKLLVRFGNWEEGVPSNLAVKIWVSHQKTASFPHDYKPQPPSFQIFSCLHMTTFESVSIFHQCELPTRIDCFFNQRRRSSYGNVSCLWPYGWPDAVCAPTGRCLSVGNAKTTAGHTPGLASPVPDAWGGICLV